MKKIRKLLVAEDDVDVKYMYDFILKKAGYDVVNAYNGVEAIEQYKKHSPDLVLMDIVMPVKNGDEAIKEIREYDPEAKMVVVSAYKYNEDDFGVPVMRRGFRKEDLFAIIDKHFKQHDND